MRIRRYFGALLTVAAIAAPATVALAAPAADPSEAIGLDLGRPDPDRSASSGAPTAADADPSAFSTDGQARTQATTTAPVKRTTTVSAKATGLYQLPPVRLVDTRQTVAVGRDSTLRVPVADAFGVPKNASAAVINLTVVDPTGSGFVSAYPCGAALGTSTINFAAKQTIANLSVVALGTGGAVCVTPSVTTHIIVDLSGYVAVGGQLYNPLGPVRALDTRQPSGSLVRANTPTELIVSGVNGVPASGVAAVSVNVTVATPGGAGYATVYPCADTPPLASNVNFARGQGAAANGAIVGLGANGAICILSSVDAHLIVDVGGWFGASGTEVQPTEPTRLTDTREKAGRVKANNKLQVFAAPGALGSVINVTVTQPVAGGYLTIWDCGASKPETSALNFSAGQTIANAVLAPVSTTGTVCISPSVDTQVIVDRTAVLGLQGSGSLDSTGSVVTDWALTQTGAPYVAMNPYRFGDSKYGKAWDCADGAESCSRVDTQGKTRTAAAGSFVYDCSGLVVAAWLQAGVDLVKKNAAWTEVMLKNLPQVSREEAQIGDLVLFDFDPTDSTPVEHVGLYISETEMVHAGTCKGGVSQVCRTTINWKNVVAIARPN